MCTTVWRSDVLEMLLSFCEVELHVCIGQSVQDVTDSLLFLGWGRRQFCELNKQGQKNYDSPWLLVLKTLLFFFCLVSYPLFYGFINSTPLVRDWDLYISLWWWDSGSRSSFHICFRTFWIVVMKEYSRVLSCGDFIECVYVCSYGPSSLQETSTKKCRDDRLSVRV